MSPPVFAQKSLPYHTGCPPDTPDMTYPGHFWFLSLWILSGYYIFRSECLGQEIPDRCGCDRCTVGDDDPDIISEF